MHYSPHQLAYFAHKLTLRAATDSMDRMAGALLDAQVDLNPHQIDAALFATSNPLSKGAILADEVGLGKTIEAGLLIAQRWAERRRRILVIAPANLRKQWHQELADKFGLPATILEAKSFRQAIKDGVANPFDAASTAGTRSDRIVICSYQFAAGKAEAVKCVPWDLVVVDEAHRLRNVYKPDNKTARTLRDALSHVRKIFLTATPLQNSLLELYGLVSFIDDRVFGDLDSFRQQFGQLREAGGFEALKHRIGPICKRTLRRQVEAYVKYTKRIPLLREFKPGDDEARLYELVSPPASTGTGPAESRTAFAIAAGPAAPGLRRLWRAHRCAETGVCARLRGRHIRRQSVDRDQEGGRPRLQRGAGQSQGSGGLVCPCVGLLGQARRQAVAVPADSA